MLSLIKLNLHERKKPVGWRVFLIHWWWRDKVEYQLDEQHTLYMIQCYLPEEKKITVGKLGTFFFPAGHYIYVGSAKRNIQARVNRHLKIEKKLHWHFDYFRPYVQVVKVETFDGEIGECTLFQKLAIERKGTLLVKGFGSSDCRCHTHLMYIQK